MEEKTVYNLPPFMLTGGESFSVSLSLFDPDGEEYDASADTVCLCVTYFGDKYGEKVIYEEASVDGNLCEFVVDGTSTEGMFGQYVYEIYITDTHGDKEIIGDGRITAKQNIM